MVRYRWYDGSTGSWLSEDPIGFNGDPTNLHRYVGNAATMYVDPTGLEYQLPDPELHGLESVSQSVSLGDADFARYQGLLADAKAGRPLPPGYTTWVNPNTGKVNIIPPTATGFGNDVYNGPNLWAHYANPFISHEATDWVDSSLQWGTRLGQVAAVVGAAGATVVWAWGAAGGGQFAIGYGSGHFTFGWGSGGAYTWGHGISQGFATIVGAGPGSLVNVTGIPIMFPGAVGSWIIGRPDVTNCATAVGQAFLQGWWF